MRVRRPDYQSLTQVTKVIRGRIAGVNRTFARGPAAALRRGAA